MFENIHQLKTHVASDHERIEPIKCEECNTSFNLKQSLHQHKCKDCDKKIANSLRIGSLNIGTGLFTKEELLICTHITKA